MKQFVEVKQAALMSAAGEKCYMYIFISASNETEIRIKPHQYQTSADGSTDFGDHWYWKSDPFDTGPS